MKFPHSLTELHGTLSVLLARPDSRSDDTQRQSSRMIGARRPTPPAQLRAISRNSDTLRCLAPRSTISIDRPMGALSGDDAAEDHDSTSRARCLGTPAQERRRFTIGAAADDFPQQIEVGARRQRVEETLPDDRDALRHAGSLKCRAGERHGPREIDQRPANLGESLKELREHRSGTPADVDDAPHRLPAAGDLEIRLRGAVPQRPHQCVEARADVRMGVQVVPERSAEKFMVGRVRLSGHS